MATIGRFRVCDGDYMGFCGPLRQRESWTARDAESKATGRHPYHEELLGLLATHNLLKVWTMIGLDHDEFLALIPIRNDPVQAAAFLGEVLPAIELRIAELAALPSIDARCFGVQEAAVLLALLNKLADNPLHPFLDDSAPQPEPGPVPS